MEFWIGKDKQGKKWLIKNRGPFYSLREMAFSLIAESLGINVQLSRYLILPEVINTPKSNSKYQLAIEYIEPCVTDCKSKYRAYENCFDQPDLLQALYECEHPDSLDRVKVDMLSHIFGANETSEQMCSENGRIYTVDNEQMFSTNPVELTDLDWFGINNKLATTIAVGLCSSLSNLSDKDVEMAVSVPENYVVDENWPIKPIIIRARDYASLFAEIHA